MQAEIKGGEWEVKPRESEGGRRKYAEERAEELVVAAK